VVPTFDEFIKLHSHTYQTGSAEYEQRRQLYAASVREVEAHNRNTDRMWTAAVNIMSDRTDAEIAAFNGFKKGYTSVSRNPATSSFISMLTDPVDKDLGYVMPTDHSWESVDIDGDKNEDKVEALANIRSQSCGNCWAAATNAMMEAHRQLHGGLVAKFDDDELTECSQNFFNCGGTGGCQGSTPELALMHYQKNGMLLNPDKPKNSTAPRMRVEKSNCPAMTDIVDKNEKGPHEIKDGIRHAADNSPARSFGLIGWEKLPENQGWPMMLALYERGPVAVAVATDGWRQYSSGVYGGCDKNAVIGHSVLAFGFGQVVHKGKTVKYWRLQNSWGPSFGENGHFRMLRHDADDAYCGNDQQPKDGTGCDGGPASAKICGMCGVLYDALVPYSEPVTYLAKQLQERRSMREAVEQKKSGRTARTPHQDVISVDGGGTEPSPLAPVPTTAGHRGWVIAVTTVWSVFVVTVVIASCWSVQGRSKSSSKGPEAAAAPSV
jgi:cathepsin L